MTTENLNLQAVTRKETGKKVNDLRAQGKIPAVLYGDKIDPINLQLEITAFEKIYEKAGESTLVDLAIDGKAPVKVLIQDHQLEPRINKFLHVDFFKVSMDHKIHTEIPIKFVGEAPAVKEFSGILVTSLDSLEVECLPQDLVHEIEVDLSSLKTFEDSIHVADVKVPAGMTIKNVADTVVAAVQEPRAAQEEAPVAEAVAEPALVDAKKVDDKKEETK